MAGDRASWEVIGEPLGGGGQSEVYLVRRPQRRDERRRAIGRILESDPWGTHMAETREPRTGELATAVLDYARPEAPSELGAMKVFKIRDGEEQAKNRLSTEVKVLLDNTTTGLPKLLDSNVAERWLVTEYFPEGTLEHNFAKYKGDVVAALKAFLSLVTTVAALHAQGIVHRDIKPANVFVRRNDELVLGDFGIAFLPDLPARLTPTNETVGPHDYMPPWAEGGRLGEVDACFDIYMLGKLLWCMVSGRLRLQREWFERPENNLTKQFPNDPAMHIVNVILNRCVVTEREQCKTSASDLILIASAYIQMLERGGQDLHRGVPRPCRVCGVGYYQSEGYAQTQPPIPKDSAVGLRLWRIGTSENSSLHVHPFVCDRCGHVQFFTRNAPTGS